MNDTFDLASAPGFNKLPGALIAYDMSGRVIRANATGLDILGIPAEKDIVGSSAANAGWFRTDPAGWPDPETLHPAMVVIRSGKPERGVMARVARPDGDEAWIQVDAGPDGGRVLVTFTDVSRILPDPRLPRARYGDDALGEVTNQLAAVRLDPQTTLTTVTGTLSRLRPGTWVASLINKDPRTSRVVAANDSDPLIARYVEEMHLSPSSPTFTLATQVIESGEPVLIPSIPYEEFLGLLREGIREYLDKNQPPLPTPIRYLGVLVVPMRARGATVGTLGLFERRTSNPLSQHDVRWLQAVADRTGVAAENAQLYVDAISRLERLTALRNVGLASTGSPDLRLTLRVILDQVTLGLRIAAPAALMPDDKAGHGVVVVRRQLVEPDQEWLEFLDALGSEAAIAIDNADMYDQLQKAAPAAMPKSPAPDLTRLEKEILALVVQGDSNRDIADKVHLSTNTIKFHVRQLLQKLEVENRTELAHKATREGWL